MTSPDGITWIAGLLESPLTLPSWSSAAYGGGVYAVVSRNSAMWSNTGSGFNTNELFIAGAETDGFIADDVLTTDSVGGSGTITDLTDISVTVSSPSGFQTGQRIVTSGLTANGTVASTDPAARKMFLSTTSGRWVKGTPAFGPDSTTTGNVDTVTVGSNQMTVNNVNGRFIVGRPVNGPVKELPPPAPSGDVPSDEYSLIDRDLASSDLETHNLAPYPSGTYSSSNTITNVSSVDANWTLTTNPFSGTNIFVSGANGLFLAGDTSNNFATSTDGETWSSLQVDTGFNNGGVVYAFGKYHKVVNASSPSVSIKSSSDNGANWTFVQGFSGEDGLIAFGNGRLVVTYYSGAANRYGFSTDGINWTGNYTNSIDSNPLALGFHSASNLFIQAGGNGVISTSPDGTNWTTRYTHPSGQNFNSVASDGATVVAVGQSGTFAYSTDGTNWSSTTPFGSNNLSGVKYGNGQWLAVGGNGSSSVVWKSVDGVSWTTYTASNFTLNALESLAFASNKFLASGTGGSQIGFTTGTSTRLAIAGAQSEGFIVGEVIDDCGGDAQDSTITNITDTLVDVAGSPTGWDVGDNICRPGGITANSTFFSHVKYRSDDPLDSAWSNWSAFTTGSLVPEPGDALGGGYFAGQINDGGTIYNIIVAPLASGLLQGQYGGTVALKIQYSVSSLPGATGSTNLTNGAVATLANTANDYPAPEWCITNANGPNAGTYDATNATGTGIGGFNDWYIPSYYELEICYFNLKPNSVANRQGPVYAGNPYAVPSRAGQSYGNSPAQTSVSIFQAGGSEAFTPGAPYTDFYWSSTEETISGSGNPGNYFQAFSDGNVSNTAKNTPPHYLRCTRRVPA